MERVVAHSRRGRAWCEKAWGGVGDEIEAGCVVLQFTVVWVDKSPTTIMLVAATVLLLLAEAVATSWSCSVEPQPACANS